METTTKVTVTLEQVAKFNEVAGIFMKAMEGKMSRWTNTLRHGISNTKEALSSLQSKDLDLLVDHASVDAEGVLKRDARGNYVFEPAKEKAYAQAKRKLLAETVGVEPYIYQGTDIPKGVSLLTWDLLAPFVLPELTDEKVEQLIAAEEAKEAEVKESKLQKA